MKKKVLWRVVKGGGGGGGGYRSRFTKNKNSPFTIHEKYEFGISRFTENKGEHLENHGSRQLWKSRFTRKKRGFTFHGN